MDLSNVVILVTGASSGIGKTLCNILYKYHATVIGTYFHTKSKGLIDYQKCDITKEKEVKNLVNYVIDNYGHLDVLINCAAVAQDMDYLEKDAKSFMKVIETNLLGTFLMIKYASIKMDTGVIINMSSTDGEDTYNPISIDYCASKAAVENLTKNFALRLPNIKICALAPMWVDTDSVKEMDPKYLQNEMEKHGQKKLLTKEDVSLKIIEMIINNDDYISGDIVRMEEGYNEK